MAACRKKLRPPLTTVLLLFSPELADISGILTKTWTPYCRTKRSDVTSRHCDGNMYECSAEWVTAIPQYHTFQWGHFLFSPQALLKLGTTRTAMAATATAATTRFQPSALFCRGREENMSAMKNESPPITADPRSFHEHFFSVRCQVWPEGGGQNPPRNLPGNKVTAIFWGSRCSTLWHHFLFVLWLDSCVNTIFVQKLTSISTFTSNCSNQESYSLTWTKKAATSPLPPVLFCRCHVM